MNKAKGNHKKPQAAKHAASAEPVKKGSAATAVEEALGGLEEKYDEVQKLLDIGKEKGYLLYDEVSDLLPPEISSSAEDLDDLFSAFGTAGIDLRRYPGHASAPRLCIARTSCRSQFIWQ